MATRSNAAQAVRRTWHRLARRLHRRGLPVVYSGRYVLDLAGMPQDPHRAEHILTFLAAEGLVERGDLLWPQPASFQALGRVHTEEYLEALQEPGALLRILGVRLPGGDEDRYLALQRSMAGGTRLATRRAVLGGGAAVNLGGGLHHAFADHGAGFCAFNDVAVSITGERARGFSRPILVVDLDLHDGDGTRAIFARDPTVHTFSIHNQHRAAIEAVASTSIELGSGVEDDLYLATVAEHLPPVVAASLPGLVFYLAGTDPAATDRIGDWRITAAGMLARDRFVVEELRRQLGEVPLVVLLAGGYGGESWRYSARFLGWLASGAEIEPPASDEITLARYRTLATLVSRGELTGTPAGDDWGLTEADVLPALTSLGVDDRLLGYYSAGGVELALERYGILNRLRAMGFTRPTLELDLHNSSGQTVRLFADPSRAELLTEVRLRRDRRTVTGMELLAVDWLLLQNPRRGFSPEHPPLPGQRHPGLGALKDFVSLLVLVCERLHLDGLFFVPSHYHLAAQSRRYLRFLEPEEEGRFCALGAALSRLTLGEATRAVDAGRVVDAASGETCHWQPAPMLLAVSDRLKERLEGEGYRRRAEAAQARAAFHLLPAPAAAPGNRDRAPA